MDGGRLSRLEALFGQAWERPPAERDSFLDSACPDDAALREEARVLLAIESNAGDFLNSPALLLTGAAGAAMAFADAAEEAALPERIGEFRVLSRLGAGGMGVVYKAEQERPRRLVALKVLRGGLVSSRALRRFEFESGILARLEHPAIARVLLAGTTAIGGEPRPYFAMELVEGVTLSEWYRGTRTDVRETVSLLAEVAEGVAHAHQRGVIHRDLKPGNVLIATDGVPRPSPKILDFGVARLLDGDDAIITRTEPGSLLGTLPYISPECLDGSEADTRSDVYSLGVLSYEVLCGRLPIDYSGLGPAQALQAARTSSPVPLERVRPECRGDLATIVATAMDHDPRRRYAGAAEFAADLRRFIERRPIVARPAGAWRRTALWAARHKALAAGCVLAAAGLAGGMGLALRSAGIARQERDAARAAQMAADTERDTAAAVTEFLRDMLAAADPARADRSGATVLETLRVAEREIPGRFEGRPVVEGAIRLTLGRALTGLGRPAEAEVHLRRALELAEESAGRHSAAGAEALRELGIAARELGRLPDARAALEEAERIGIEVHGERAPEVASMRTALATVVQREADYARAASLHEAALEARRAAFGENHASVAESLDGLGITLRQLGRSAEAEGMYRRALEIRTRVQRPDHPDIATTKHNLSRALNGMGRYAEAEAATRDALRIQRAAYPDGHSVIALSLRSLGVTLFDAGRFEEADEALAEAQAMYERLFPDGHGDLASTLIIRARLAGRMQKPERADEWIARAEVMARTLGNHTDRIAVKSALVQQAIRAGDTTRAESLAADRLEDCRRTFGESHQDTAHAYTALAEIAMRRGDWPGARAHIARSVEVFRAALGTEHPRIAEALHNHAYVEMAAGDHAAAAALYAQSYAMRSKLQGEAHPETVNTRYELGLALKGIPDEAAAEAIFIECRERFKAEMNPAGAVRVSDCSILIDGIRERRGEPDGAQALLEDALPHVESIIGPGHARLGPLLNALARRLEAVGRLEEAAGFKARAEQLSPLK